VFYLDFQPSSGANLLLYVFKMAAPPPRPPPPTSPLKHTTTTPPAAEPDKAPGSRPYSAEFGSRVDSQNKHVMAEERGRSKTFSGHTHNKSIPSEQRKPPPILPRPHRISRSSSSPPPPPLPTLSEGEGGREGGRGRGREGVTESSGRVPPSRPPPPARARSLPRGGSLRTWEQGNRDKIGHNQSKSSEHIHKTGGPKSPVHTKGLGTVLKGDVRSEGTSPSKTEGETQAQGNSTIDANSSQNGEEDGNETTPPQSSQPVIPPRPYLPPRPFPPPTGSSKSPTASPSHSAGSRHKNRTHKTHHGDPRHKPPVWAATENLTRSVTISQSTNQEEEKESGDTPPTDNMTPHDTPTGDHAASHDKEKDNSAGQQEAVVESASTGGITSDGGSGDQMASSSARDATSKASAKQSRSGLKGSRLFSSVRKGLSKMRHKNVRTSSLPMGLGPPPRKSTSDDMTNTLAEVQEEEEMYPDPLPQGIVDPLVILCVAYLNRDSVLREAGLFRIPGEVSSVKKIRSDYIRGQYLTKLKKIFKVQKIDRPRGYDM
jgi:hypothetical protein